MAVDKGPYCNGQQNTDEGENTPQGKSFANGTVVGVVGFCIGFMDMAGMCFVGV